MNEQSTNVTNPKPCRTCGYDLRASTDRCPECGAEILARPTSRIPWTRRKKLGPIRAYLQTTSWVLFRPWKLARELHGVIGRRDALRFHRVSIRLATSIFALLWILALATCWNEWEDMRFDFNAPFTGLHAQVVNILLHGPWIVVAAVVTQYLVTRVSLLFYRAILRFASGGAREQRRIGRLSLYLSGQAPLQALFIGTMILFGAWLGAEKPWMTDDMLPVIDLVLFCSMVASFLWTALIFIAMTGKRRWLRAPVLILVFPIILAALGEFIALAVLWVTGFIIVAIGSMLHHGG